VKAAAPGTRSSRAIRFAATTLVLCTGAQAAAPHAATSLAAASPDGPAAPAPAAQAAALKAGTFDPPRAAPELALRGSDGQPLTLARFRGKLVLMSFGFTNCAAVCPTTLATLAEARRALGPAAADVQVLFVTVDPERDDAARLKTYVSAFDRSFVGGTGSPEALGAVRKAYGVTANKVAMKGSYAVDHTSSIFLIDREGRLRAMMPFGHGAKDFVHDARLLLSK
jgi:protein SCO1